MGEYRRNVTTAYRNHDFFRPDNNVAMTIRTNCAKHALDDVVDWLENGGGEVAVSYQVKHYYTRVIQKNFSLLFWKGFRCNKLHTRAAQND